MREREKARNSFQLILQASVYPSLPPIELYINHVFRNERTSKTVSERQNIMQLGGLWRKKTHEIILARFVSIKG